MGYRVLHLATSIEGGAGIAALRLSQLQNEHGYSSTVLDLAHSTSSTFARIIGKVITFIQLKITRPIYGIVTPISKNNLDLNQVLKFKPEVIHVHNWYNLLDFATIKKLSEIAPLVFTLHDQRLFTGGCHNSISCCQFKSGCLNCPAVLLGKFYVRDSFTRITDLFGHLRNYSIIAPSEWMIVNAKSSGQFPTARDIVKIPNVISQASYQSIIPGQSGTEMNILFIAAQLDLSLKGLELLLSAIRNFNVEGNSNFRKIHLTLIGKSDKDYSGDYGHYKVNQLSRQEPEGIRQKMAESELLIVPSLSENSPNVIGEAQLSGLLVAGARVGGIPELIDDHKTGFLFNLEISEIQDVILNYMQISETEINVLKMNAKSVAIQRYNEQVLLEQTGSVYEKLLKGRNG